MRKNKSSGWETLFSVTEVMWDSAPKPILFQSGGEVFSKCLMLTLGLGCWAQPLQRLTPEALTSPVRRAPEGFTMWLHCEGGGDRNSQKYGLIGGSRSLGWCSWELFLSWSLCSFCSLADWGEQLCQCSQVTVLPASDTKQWVWLTLDCNLWNSKPSGPSTVCGTEGEKGREREIDCPV